MSSDSSIQRESVNILLRNKKKKKMKRNFPNYLIFACTVRESKKFICKGVVGAEAMTLPGSKVVFF